MSSSFTQFGIGTIKKDNSLYVLFFFFASLVIYLCCFKMHPFVFLFVLSSDKIICAYLPNMRSIYHVLKLSLFENIDFDGQVTP